MSTAVIIVAAGGVIVLNSECIKWESTRFGLLQVPEPARPDSHHTAYLAPTWGPQVSGKVRSRANLAQTRDATWMTEARACICHLRVIRYLPFAAFAMNDINAACIADWSGGG